MESESTDRACCVGECDRSPVLVVAQQGRSETLMCLGHAREWVASDECRAIARNKSAGAMRLSHFLLKRFAEP
jgi:hypothetical protein